MDQKKERKVKPRYRLLFFSSSGGVAFLHLRRSYSNIFLTLTDMKHNVLKCITSGRSNPSFTKRQKRAPMALESMVRTLMPTFFHYKIRKLVIFMKSRISSFYYTLVKELKFHGLRLHGVIVQRKVAFNGVRKRKLRRV